MYDDVSDGCRKLEEIPTIRGYKGGAMKELKVEGLKVRE